MAALGQQVQLKRFATHTEEEISEKRMKVIPDNTAKANRKCATILRTYLVEKGENGDFENFDAEQLNKVLEHFYLDARKTDGELYRSSSPENFRYGLNRYLKSPPNSKTFDLIKSCEFNTANESFKTAKIEIKAAGKGECEHYPVVNDVDLKKLYCNVRLSTLTHVGLQNKVQLDLRLYFCRRGMEKFTEMTKDSFRIDVDPVTNLRYVCKAKGELSKNRRESDKENYGGFMTEVPGSSYCPVQSYEKYVMKLNPDNNRLWQRPLDTFHDEDPVWYSKQPVGRDKLSSYMTNLSKSCGLSKVYTNHSLRATSVTILARNNFSPAQIMSVSGHKATSSMSIYHSVSDKEKMAMGVTINKTINSSNSNFMVHGDPLSSITTNPQVSKEASLVPVNTGPCSLQDTPSDLDALLRDFNPDDLFSDFNCESDIVSSKNSVPVAVQSQQKFPCLFSNCSIGKVEIVFRK